MSELEGKFNEAQAAISERAAYLDRVTGQIRSVEQMLRTNTATPAPVWIEPVIGEEIGFAFWPTQRCNRLLYDAGKRRPLLETPVDVRLRMVEHLPALLEAVRKAAVR